MDFSKLAAGKRKTFDPNDDTVKRKKGSTKLYVQHACDLVTEITEFRAGKVDNAGSRIDKHHFAAVKARIVQINHQAEHLPQKPSEAAAGRPLQPAQALREGQEIDLFITLPRFFHDDANDYTTKELHQIGDLTDLVAAIMRVEPDVVDVADINEWQEGDGAAIRGIKLGVKYDERIVEAEPDRNRREWAGVDTNPYPVAQETLDREDPSVVQERTNYVACSALGGMFSLEVDEVEALLDGAGIAPVTAFFMPEHELSGILA